MAWASADFVYMPLNTSKHGILLVLDINGKRIRLYDSLKKRGDSLSIIRPYIPCLESFLPKLMERFGVYDKRREVEMEKANFHIDMVRECPQRDDGGNCGMFVIKFAEYLMVDRDVEEVSKEDTEMYRQKMMTELLLYVQHDTVESSN